jgi:chitinase
MATSKYALAMTFAAIFGFMSLVHAQVGSPVAPRNISVMFVAPSHIIVSWSQPSYALGIAGYYIYRNGSIIGNTRNQTFTDTVTPGTYTYAVAAYNAANYAMVQSALSSPVSVVADTIDPAPPTGLTAVAATSSVALAWAPARDNVGIAGYYVYRNNIRIVTPNPITGTDFTDKGMPGGTAHTYTVIAYDAAGNLSGASAPVEATTILDITPPSVPAVKSVVVISSSEIDVTWATTTDAVAVGGYILYRAGAKIATVNASTTFFADQNLKPRTSYIYTLAAFDTTGNVSGQSSGVMGTTLPPDVTAPSVPMNLAGKNLAPQSVTLTWSPSRDDIGVSGYKIYRNQKQIVTIATSTFADYNLATNTIYIYAVSAYDKAGNSSAWSDIVRIKTPAMAAPPTKFIFTGPLYVGQRDDSVTALQTVLVSTGYLAPTSTTGIFDAVTEKALQKFQCIKGIVCSGSPPTTGWGSVGARTRKVLNALP